MTRPDRKLARYGLQDDGRLVAIPVPKKVYHFRYGVRYEERDDNAQPA